MTVRWTEQFEFKDRHLLVTRFHEMRVDRDIGRSEEYRKIIMEPCIAVEREVDKVLQKFGAIKDHADSTLSDLIKHIESLKNELEAGMKPLPLARFIYQI